MKILKFAVFVASVAALSAGLLFGSVMSLDAVEAQVPALSHWMAAVGGTGLDAGRLVPPLGTGLVILAVCLGIIAPLRVIYKTPVVKVFTTTRRFRWRMAFAGIATMAIFQSFSVVLVTGWDAKYSLLSGNLIAEIIFLISVILVYALSAPLEELIFRRWILFTKTNTLVRCVIMSAVSAAIFSAAHLSNDWIVLSSHFVSGLAYAWPVVRFRGLEFSMGAHLAKNVSLACIIGLPGERQWGDEFSAAALAVMATSVAVALVAECIFQRRKFNQAQLNMSKSMAMAPTSI